MDQNPNLQSAIRIVDFFLWIRLYLSGYVICWIIQSSEHLFFIKTYLCFFFTYYFFSKLQKSLKNSVRICNNLQSEKKTRFRRLICFLADSNNNFFIVLSFMNLVRKLGRLIRFRIAIPFLKSIPINIKHNTTHYHKIHSFYWKERLLG